MRDKKFQVFPFEYRHECSLDSCYTLNDACVMATSKITPIRLRVLGALNKGPYLKDVPRIVNSKFYLIRIKYPASTPLVKLININGAPPTVKDILVEFAVFFREIVETEIATLADYSDTAIKCKKCLKSNVQRFKILEPSETAEKCCICWGNEEAQVVLDCGHNLHAHCLQSWFKVKNSCPLCRVNIEPCECKGTRLARPNSPRSFNNGRSTRSTGIYRLQPYNENELSFTCLVYERDSNMFHLKGSI